MWRILLITLILPINIHALDFNESSSNFLNIADYIVNISSDTKALDTNVREIIKDGVDEAIIEIRALEEIDAYILQRSVDEVRKNAFNVLGDNLRVRVPTSQDLILYVKEIFDEAITEMDLNLEALSDLDVDLSETNIEVEEELDSLGEVVEEYVINLEGLDLIYIDTDLDGLTDFEELYIYGSNASSTNTASSTISDSEKVMNNIDPRSVDTKISFGDPRDVSSQYVSDIYEVIKLQLVTDSGEVVSSTTGNDNSHLYIEGTGFPNTYLTINIFSTHIIVNVRVDETGKWSYTFNEKIEEGDHTIYLSNSNSDGDILAVSEPISFFITDEVAKIGNLVVEDLEGEAKRNITLIFLGIVLVVVFLLVPALRRK